MLETRVHLFFFDKLATIGLGDSLLHKRTEILFFRDQF